MSSSASPHLISELSLIQSLRKSSKLCFGVCLKEQIFVLLYFFVLVPSCTAAEQYKSGAWSALYAEVRYYFCKYTL